jgi:hypothetical protein
LPQKGSSDLEMLVDPSASNIKKVQSVGRDGEPDGGVRIDRVAVVRNEENLAAG